MRSNIYLLAFALSVTVSGCASNAPGSRSGSDRKTITLWHHQTAGEGPHLIQQAVDRFQSSYPNVDVEVVPINNDAFKTKIKVAIGAGNAPCIFPSWGGGTLREYVRANQVVDMLVSQPNVGRSRWELARRCDFRRRLRACNLAHEFSGAV